jgi:hypothetical protein
MVYVSRQPEQVPGNAARISTLRKGMEVYGKYRVLSGEH